MQYLLCQLRWATREITHSQLSITDLDVSKTHGMGIVSLHRHRKMRPLWVLMAVKRQQLFRCYSIGSEVLIDLRAIALHFVKRNTR